MIGKIQSLLVRKTAKLSPKARSIIKAFGIFKIFFIPFSLLCISGIIISSHWESGSYLGKAPNKQRCPPAKLTLKIKSSREFYR